MSKEVNRLVPNEKASDLDELRLESRPLFSKAKNILDDHKLEIAKGWLARIVAQIEDLETLESFPTRESIRTSVELIEGLANSLLDSTELSEFLPGGDHYQKATILGEAAGGDEDGVVAVAQSMLALENSVWDLLAKSLRREDAELLRLVVRLRVAFHGMSTSAIQARFEKSASELDRLAHTDSLTGLYNRRFMLRELDRHIEIFRRYRHPFSILMLDLDNLKWVNDTYGHSVGDAALKQLATLMKANVRDVDLACRQGGDEFVVIMPETEKGKVEVVGRRIAESLAKTKLKAKSHLITLEVSRGFASCPEDGTEAEELLQAADATLYREKESKDGESVSVG